MATFNVRLKPSKCSFGMQSIEFLGHIFDENGVKLSNSRVQGIRDLPEPTTLKGVRSFIGMVYYFRDFIKPSYPSNSTHQEKCYTKIFSNDSRSKRCVF